MRQILFLTFGFLAIAGLAACSIYRVDVQQGNVVTQKDLNQIHKGMNKEQVRAILGSPLLEDPWHPDQWIYSYSNKPAYGTTTVRNLILHFGKDGELESISGDVISDDGQGAPR